MKVLICFLCSAVVSYAQWQPEIIWERDGAGDHSRYGADIFSLGDQNDDGFMDLGVTAWGSGAPGQASEALTEFFYGGNPPSAEPYVTFRGTAQQELFWVKRLGDINGDGYIDWAVAVDTTVAQHFVVRIYYGGSDLNPDYTFYLPNDLDLWEVGDFNGDGFDDLYFYDWAQDIGQILFGGTEIDTTPDWTRHSPPEYHQQALLYVHGDLNGDGFSDLINWTFENQDAFWLHVFWGGVNPDTLPGLSILNFDWTGVKIVNDLNGDGRDDLVQTVGMADIGIYFGGEQISNIPSVVVSYGCGVQRFAGVGDVNHDGYNDFAVASHSCNSSMWGTGAVYLGNHWINTNPAFEFNGRQAPWDLIGIWWTAGLGDVNGDSVDDFAFGAFNSDFDGWRGRAIVLAGDSTVVTPVDDFSPTSPKDFALSVYPNPFNAQTTIEFDIPRGSSRIELEIYNTLGQVVCSENLPALGTTMRYNFRAEGLGSGVYIARAITGSMTATRKMMLLR